MHTAPGWCRAHKANVFLFISSRWEWVSGRNALAAWISGCVHFFHLSVSSLNIHRLSTAARGPSLGRNHPADDIGASSAKYSRVSAASMLLNQLVYCTPSRGDLTEWAPFRHRILNGVGRNSVTGINSAVDGSCPPFLTSTATRLFISSRRYFNISFLERVQIQ